MGSETEMAVVNSLAVFTCSRETWLLECMLDLHLDDITQIHVYPRSGDPNVLTIAPIVQYCGAGYVLDVKSGKLAFAA